MAASPILDLSYRNYDGPIEPPVARWWAIAKMTIRLGMKKRGFWVWSVLSAYWYLILMAIFFFVDSFLPPEGTQQFFARVVWKDQFLTAFSFAQLVYFILALLIGVGTIANDNRANALLVYLSKPCTKFDYVLGKWLGIFMTLSAVALVPAILFYLYGVLSFRSYGFFSQDPWMFFRVIGMCLISGTFHASVALGISSLFNQGRMAGATYAGIYFLGLFFTKAMEFISLNTKLQGEAPSPVVHALYYLSPDGLQIAMAKFVLGTNGSNLFQQNNRPGRPQLTPIEAPNMPLFTLLFLGICLAGVLVAWRRVRAVEVVGGS